MKVDVNKDRDAIAILGVSSPKGGMFEYAKCWKAKLVDQGKDPVIVSNSNILSQFFDVDKIIYDSKISDFGYRKYFLKFLFSLFYFLRQGLDLRRDLLAMNVKRIRVVDDFSYSSLHLLLFLCLFRGGFQIVATIHDPISHEGHFKNFFAWCVSKTNRFVMRQLNNVGLCLHFHGEKLINNTPWATCKNVLFDPHPLPEKTVVGKRSPDRIKIIFAGRIEVYKGLDDLLEAYSCLNDNRPNLLDTVDLFIVGKGTISSRAKSIIDSVGQVFLVNEFVSDEQLHQHIADSDILLLPYRSATASGVGALGVIYDVRILATDVGELSYLTTYNKHSKLISPNNVQAIVETLAMMLEDLIGEKKYG